MRGFTLIELLTTIGIIAVLAGLIIPAVGKAKAKVLGTVCVNNLAQLQKCWIMYADDHNDRVPPNESVLTNGAWRSSSDSWIGNSNALLDSTDEGIRSGLLFKYDYNKSLDNYHCPADRSRVQQPGGGRGVRRIRSYSMNGNLGGRTNEVQATVYSVQQVPDPARLFVFIDEDEESIDDAHFLVWPEPDERWVNLPADRHNQSGVMSFVDGHVETWRWRYPKTFSPKQSYWKEALDENDLTDLRRLQRVVLPVAEYKPQR